MSSQLLITDRSNAVILLWFSIACFCVVFFGDLKYVQIIFSSV